MLAVRSLGVAVAAAVLAAAGVASALAQDPDHARKISAAADAYLATGAPGAVVFFRDRSRTTVVARGYADTARRIPMRPDDRFRIGSVTKTFVATVVLQLVAEHKFALSDDLDRLLPGLVPNGGAITVRHLLQQTSGLFDYTEDRSMLAVDFFTVETISLQRLYVLFFIELGSWLLIVNTRHFEHVLRVVAERYNPHRPQRSLRTRTTGTDRLRLPIGSSRDVRRHDRLGRLIHEYSYAG